ncbi:MAG TPA: hypothetical protein VFK02_29350 [Kofleriaceae bacterium]|nr:hypothetical protein [Kofleriaceae bacterium]
MPTTLLIVSPKEGASYNQLRLDVTVSVADPQDHGSADSQYKYLRLFVNNDPVEQRPTGGPGTYTFKGVDFSSYANNRAGVRIEARANRGDSIDSHYVASPSIHIVIDTAAPRIVELVPADGARFRAAPAISATIQDAGGSGVNRSTIAFLIDGQVRRIAAGDINPIAAAEGIDAVTVTVRPEALPDGLHAVEVQAADVAGNSAPSAKTTFLVDSTPPAIQSVFPDGAVDRARLHDPVTVVAVDVLSAIDVARATARLTTAGGRSIELTARTADPLIANRPATLQFGEPDQIAALSVGTHTLALSVSDALGNTTTRNGSFTVAHAVPFENGAFQVCQSYTTVEDRPTSEPCLLPPHFVWDKDVVLTFAGLATGASAWSHRAGAIEASALAGSHALELRLPGSGLWSGDVAIRDELFADFGSVLAQVDSDESSVFQPGAAATLRARVTRAIPLPISELLPWSCGLDRARRAVELLPGFQLRLQPASFQYVGPGRDAMNGMVVGGELVVPVTRSRGPDGRFRTGLSPWNGELSPQSYSVADDRPDETVGGLADLMAGDLRRKHLALVLPSTLPSSSTDSAVAAEHVTLVAADTRAALAEGIRAAGDNRGSDVTYAVRTLRGRTAATVEIPIWIDGQPGFVALGTTLRQLADRCFHWFDPTIETTGQIAWTRQWTEPDGRVALRATRWLDLGLAPGGSSADLGDAPLLPGDRIEVRIRP